MPQGQADYKTKKAEKIKEPSQYNVVFLNDDYTTMDFVVFVLMSVFHKNSVEAERIMMEVHRKGKGVAGRYVLDIAQTKVMQVGSLAAKYQYPLKCILEEA
jgi:ATP-dependent Clp protease adaptor protein ClpS